MEKFSVSRGKKQIKEMIPIKKWLSVHEACSYLDVSNTTLKKLARENRLSISALGSNKLYYRVSELDKLIEDHITIK